MKVTITAVQPSELEPLIPLLLLAEPSEDALRWSLGHLSDTVYCMDVEGRPVAAASVRWADDPAEIVELAVAADYQGQGLGKRLVQWLIAEARHRGRSALIVGTGNASIGNLIFYQKCGFRMDHVRKDYFWYKRPPKVENGMRERDTLVFRYDLGGRAHAPKR
jgi:GNAT superfamily N-acetyltransferase